MLDKKILRQSLAFAAAAVLYVVVVATFMQNAARILGPDDGNAIAPIVFLLLLVVSAATMGMLIFAKPVMLYLDGKKREAVMMMGCTIGALAAFTVVLFVIAAVSRA